MWAENPLFTGIQRQGPKINKPIKSVSSGGSRRDLVSDKDKKRYWESKTQGFYLSLPSPAADWSDNKSGLLVSKHTEYWVVLRLSHANSNCHWTKCRQIFCNDFPFLCGGYLSYQSKLFYFPFNIHYTKGVFRSQQHLNTPMVFTRLLKPTCGNSSSIF